MKCTLLAQFFAISFVTMGTLIVAASSSASESDEVYTVLKKGKEIGEAKKENDEKLKVLENQVEQKKTDELNLKAAETNWNAAAADFNRRCQRNFFRGEETALAACQTERGEIAERDKEIKQTRKAIDAWNSEFNSLKQRRMELRTEMALWVSTARINKMLKKILGECEVSGTDFDTLLYGYGACFDGRKTKHERLDIRCIGTCVSPNSPRYVSPNSPR